ncbi:PREDICTED: FERM, RhoGEF and pleckstrin domain-containing protein 2-like [Papilio polytes]|uniref:FERM, RhoGEF and pleckstrin domain-containing protein 2-like n=1 Tax=Papilio polytes TaxID=76194 RepID=UPI000676479B|nr:PREDICTED: FERM, RhoGEF and pleckstrin domain-containing protein 2-like [Papilio polytes]
MVYKLPGKELSPEDDERTVSSASLCMSPGAEPERGAAPLCSSTPFAPRLTNGYDVLDNRDRRHLDSCDTINGNVNVHIVSESTNSMDVLSGGESDAGDTLSRRNNNSISSRIAYCSETQRRRGDVTYFVAKELLMTERTYKRDLELVTVTWSRHVGRVASAGAEGAEASALARGCLALEPLALPAGALLARLDRALATAPHTRNEFQTSFECLLTTFMPPYYDDNEEPEYKKIADMLHDYLTNIYDAYEQYALGAGALVALAESARRRGGAGARAAAEFDASSPLPLAALLLRPLHRALHLRRLAHELSVGGCGGRARAALEVATRMAALALQQLPHVENHSALCQVQRDITGYDKLLVAEREFIRLGCLYKHSTKGLQQRMLFLFSDLLLIASKCSVSQFRAHLALPLHSLQLLPSDLPNSFTLSGEDTCVVLSAGGAGGAAERAGWCDALAAAIERARERPTHVDTQLTAPHTDECSGAGAGGALTFVCWHRAASLTRQHLNLAIRTQLSGYLLRKFKNSHGWQKLWVVFAAFTLFFYKSWQDETPLASLPLLGWIEVLQTPMLH